MASPQRISRKRMLVLLAVLGFLFLALGYRLVDLQVIQRADLQQRALRQWTQDTVVSAARGRILDRNGKVLAQSASSVYITVSPENLNAKAGDKRPAAAQLFAEVLGLDYESTLTRISDLEKKSVTVARKVPKEVANEMKVLAKEREIKSGIYYSEDMTRVYPRNNFLSQIIGFTNVDSDGQTGVEAAYNKYLAGENGHVYTEKDRKGRPLTQNAAEYVAPVAGYDVVLTFDYVIQSFAQSAAEKCMEETGAKSVQALVMDVNTGELLASVVLPDFDLNNPPRSDIELLNSLSKNKVITDSYEPGSTFKILTAAAALDSGAATLNSHYHCGGSILVDGDKISCWRSYEPHGSQSFTEAVTNSCNPVFVQLALKMGRTVFYDYMEAFGIGSKTGVDLVGEAAGQVIAEKYVKDLELARIGFGQSVAVTPIQLLAAASSVVNGGYLYQPYVVKQLVDENGAVMMENNPTVVSKPISEETSAQMREVLEHVVTSGGGRNAYVPGYRIGGKTGTAQKYVNGMISNTLHIGSFIGFAPMENPQVAVLLLCDEPQIRPDFGSVVAAPYAGELLQNILQYMNVEIIYSDADRDNIGRTATVPDVMGMSHSDAAERLTYEGFRFMSQGEGAMVTEQVPAAGTEMDFGAMVIIYSDVGEEGASIVDENAVEVPNIIGMSLMEAHRTLETHGLKMRISGSGVATEQSPAGGRIAQIGDTVRVTFAAPAAPELSQPLETQDDLEGSEGAENDGNAGNAAGQ